MPDKSIFAIVFLAGGSKSDRQGGLSRVTHNGLSTILNNPFYVGLMRIRKSREIYQGQHEPLISKRLFDSVQSGLKGRFPTRTKVHEFLFRRLVTCNCGYSLIGETHKGHVYYRCQQKDCPTTSLREEQVASAVESALSELQFTPPEQAYLLGALKVLRENWAGERARYTAGINGRLQKVEERLKRLTDAYLDNVLDQELFTERKNALFLERKALENGLRGDPSAETLENFLELPKGVLSLYQIAANERKRRLLKTITSNFRLNEKNIEFTFVPPFDTISQRPKYIEGSANGNRTC
jgi:site-specific DNA recombinase